MAAAGYLSTGRAVAGFGATEHLQILQSSLGMSVGSHSCAALLYTATNLAGVPLGPVGRDFTAAGDPTAVTDQGVAVPHANALNWAGDGWSLRTATASVASLAAQLQVGDLVRVYAYGNDDEASLINGHGVAHSFVVSRITASSISVIDNWGGVVTEHSFDDIVKTYAVGGRFGAAYADYLDVDWVKANFAALSATVQGHGVGRFAGLCGSSFDAGANVWRGGTGRDSVHALGGNDTLQGWSGNDTLWGGAGQDRLTGGAGNDRLYGGSGRDVIDGGSGSDVLTGGAGADSFVFHLGTGRDRITDLGEDDVIRISAQLAGTATGSFLSSHSHDSTAGLVIDLGTGHSLLIANVHSTDDLADNLIFV